MEQLTIEQRFALQRARYEVSRMSRPALEKTAVRLLRSRMEQKNGVQSALLQNGIVFKIDEQQEGLPEIISEETFISLLEMQGDDEIPNDIMDTGYEDEDLDGDDLMFL
jgi:type II secretory pathway predicted ATPase ExeA